MEMTNQQLQLANAMQDTQSQIFDMVANMGFAYVGFMVAVLLIVTLSR